MLRILKFFLISIHQIAFAQFYFDLTPDQLKQQLEVNKIDLTQVSEWRFVFVDTNKNRLLDLDFDTSFSNYTLSQVYILPEEDDPENIGYAGYFSRDILIRRQLDFNCLFSIIKTSHYFAKDQKISFIGYDAIKGYVSEDSKVKIVKVLDRDTERPIPFAEISLMEKNVGLLANEEGLFDLPNDVSQTENILIQAFGYDSMIVAVKNLGTDIYLEPNDQQINLEEIVVKSSNKTEKITLGNRHFKNNRRGYISGNGVGAEAGIFIRNNTTFKPQYLSVHIGENFAESFALRALIYEVDSNGKPSKRIFEKVVKSDIKDGWLNVFIDTNILLRDNFFVAFQWLDGLNQNPKFSFGRGSRYIYFQKSSVGSPWIRSVDFKWAIKCNGFLVMD